MLSHYLTKYPLRHATVLVCFVSLKLKLLQVVGAFLKKSAFVCHYSALRKSASALNTMR